MRAPWYVWTALLSVSCIVVGAYWDISWHMTIGRDSFWTPAHIAIQLGGIIAGTCGAYLIIATTLGRTNLRATSVRVWGFRGPLGAFIAVWGAAAMVISAPFDNWWHDAYGLDVKILSPPHAVLTLGVLGVATGGVLQIVSALNRSGERRLDAVLLAIAGEVLVLGMIAILEMTFRSSLHRAEAYRAIAIIAPLMMLAFGRVSNHRWSTTIIAGVYTGFMAAMVWLFPLFPAEAKLGPVYQPISHFIPLQFPMLVIAPAFAIDLVRPRLEARPRWQRALVFGPLFVAVLLVAQWPFAEFLMSEHARNWFFGAHYMPYMMHPEWYEARYEFMPDPNLVGGLVQAVIAACATSYLGLLLGDAMRKAKR